MCGIVGKVSVEGVVDGELVASMCEVIRHRGPDSQGVFADEGVGLGVRRLRVIDLDTGDQPIFNEDRSVVVVLNGEIYNFVELAEGLRARGHSFSTRSDTEVIVHLYEDHGVDCVRFLRGMFAFALWDRRRRLLLLARDRVGKKPLFYTQRAGELWFGSEAKSILQDPAVERRPDLDAIDSFLHFQYVPDPLSAFAGFRKLPPAHTLLWRDGRVELSRYWRLSYRRGPLTSPSEAEEAIRERLLEATRVRLRSDVPLGAFLSGGVDSSAVVAAMARQGGQVKTFSIGFDVAGFDESRFAREVARLYGTDHHELRVQPSALEVLPRLVWHYGEPFADHSAIPSFYLAELTSRHVTVALNGDGGDENFAGYYRYIRKNTSERLAVWPRPARLALRAVARTLRRGTRDNTFRARLDRVTRTSLMPFDARYAAYAAHFNEDERARLYTPEFAASLGEWRTAPSVMREPYLASDAQDAVNRLLDTDLHTYLPGDLLVKMDIASMAHSLEVRSPLLDHQLMEFAAALPAEWKISGLTTKKIFKDALRPWLPGHILDRPKQGFGVPLGDWFRGQLRQLPREILLDPQTLARGWFRTSAIRQLIDDHENARSDNTNKLWSLIQLELWLRTFIDTKPALAPTLNIPQLVAT